VKNSVGSNPAESWLLLYRVQIPWAGMVTEISWSPIWCEVLGFKSQHWKYPVWRCLVVIGISQLNYFPTEVVALGWIFLEIALCPFLTWVFEWVDSMHCRSMMVGFLFGHTPPSSVFFLASSCKREVVNHSTRSNKWFFWQIDLYSSRNCMLQ
jgi:hypothetical protein